MVVVDLKLLHAVENKRTGKVYYYAWRGGPRIHAPYGTPEFFEEWKAAKAPAFDGDRRKLAAWVELFRRSEEYSKEFADSTRRVWGPWLDRIDVHFGKLPVAYFDRPLIRVAITDWRDKWRANPRSADYAKQVLSRVLAYVVAKGALKTNPCPGIPNLYASDRSARIWTAEDLEQLCAHASKEVAWAARLAALTGLRQGDLLKLAWGNIGKHAIEIKTGKSKGRRTASPPLTQEIRDLLETIPHRAVQVITNSNGQAWRGFGSSWNKALITAKMQDRDLHFHDFRGTAATNYYRAGFTIREIANIMGWSEEEVEKLIDKYVKRDEIFADRVRRMELLKKV